MAIYPHTSDQKHKSFTDFSLKKDNDHTLSTQALSEFVPDLDFYHLGYRSGSIGTHTGWNTGLYESSSTNLIVFQYNSSSLFTEYADPQNHFVNINVGNFTGTGDLAYLGRVFKTPNTGLYTFNAAVDGEAIFTFTSTSLDNINKGGFISLQLRKYTPDSNFVYNYAPVSEIIYETEPIFYKYILSSSNFTAHITPNSTQLTLYNGNTTFTDAYVTSSGFLPWEQWPTSWTLDPIEFGNVSFNYNNVYNSNNFRFKAPLNGDYKFKVNLRGSFKQHLTGYFPFGLGSGEEVDLSARARIIVRLKKYNPTTNTTTTLATHSTSFTHQKTVELPSLIQPGYYTQHDFNQTQYFDLLGLFENNTISLQQDEEIFITAVVQSIYNNDPNHFITEYTPIQNFSLFGEPAGPSFFSCIEATYTDEFTTNFNIQLNETFQLHENEAILPVLKLKGVAPNEVLPNSRKQGLHIDTLKIGDYKTHFKKTYSQENVITIGPYLSMDNADGHNSYQPLKGSFYVDLSDIQASPTHPVLVQVPLHGFSKYTDLSTDLDIHNYNYNSPNSRRFLNHSLELNVSTFSNRVANRRRPGETPLNHNSVLTGLKRATNVTYHANFVHYGSGFTELSYNSAPITRFDSWGTGFTDSDLIDSPLFDFLPNEDIIAIDDFGYSYDDNIEINSIFGIYQGPGSVSGLPQGAEIAPRIRLTNSTHNTDSGVNVLLPYKSAYQNIYAGYNTGPLPFVGATVVDTPWPYTSGLQEASGYDSNDEADFMSIDGVNPFSSSLDLSYKNWHVDGPFPWLSNYANYDATYGNSPFAPENPPTAYYKAPYGGLYGFTFKLSVFLVAAGVAGAFQGERVRVRLRKAPYFDPTNPVTIGISEWLNISNNIYLTQNNTISHPEGHIMLYENSYGPQYEWGWVDYTYAAGEWQEYYTGWGMNELSAGEVAANLAAMDAWSEWTESYGIDSVPDPQAGIVGIKGGFVQPLVEGEKVWMDLEFAASTGGNWNISSAEVLNNIDQNYDINVEGMIFEDPPHGFSVYPPFSSFNTIQPVYEFMVTSNNPKTIVKGTYNYY